MGKLTIGIAAFAIALCAAVELAASPAATQTWVKNYVATNAVSSASVVQMSTNVTISLARSTEAAIQILMDGGSNSVQRACQALNADADAIVGSIMDNQMGL